MAAAQYPRVLGLLLSALSGCGPSVEPNNDPEDPGVLKVLVQAEGLLPDDSTGIVVDGVVRATASPWKGEAVQILVAPGQHTIGLSDIAPNCVGSDAPRKVTVSAAKAATLVGLRLRCTGTGPVARLRYAFVQRDTVFIGGGDRVDGDWIHPLAPGSSAAWFPDGRDLAVVERFGGTIWRLDVSDQSPPVRLYQSEGELGDLAWSPDGHQLAFFWCGGGDPQSGDCGVHEVRVLRDGAVQTLGKNLWTPAWVPDGSELAAGGPWLISRFDQNGIALPAIKPPPSAMGPFALAYSPDGNNLAYVVRFVTSGPSLHLQNLHTQADQEDCDSLE